MLRKYLRNTTSLLPSMVMSADAVHSEIDALLPLLATYSGIEPTCPTNDVASGRSSNVGGTCSSSKLNRNKLDPTSPKQGLDLSQASSAGNDDGFALFYRCDALFRRLVASQSENVTFALASSRKTSGKNNRRETKVRGESDESDEYVKASTLKPSSLDHASCRAIPEISEFDAIANAFLSTMVHVDQPLAQVNFSVDGIDEDFLRSRVSVMAEEMGNRIRAHQNMKRPTLNEDTNEIDLNGPTTTYDDAEPARVVHVSEQKLRVLTMLRVLLLRERKSQLLSYMNFFCHVDNILAEDEKTSSSNEGKSFSVAISEVIARSPWKSSTADQYSSKLRDLQSKSISSSEHDFIRMARHNEEFRVEWPSPDSVGNVMSNEATHALLPEIVLTDKHRAFQDGAPPNKSTSTGALNSKGDKKPTSKGATGAALRSDRLVHELALERMRHVEERLIRLGTTMLDREEEDVTDRVRLLLDLYESETRFQWRKVDLIRLYLRAYGHCLQTADRQRLRTVIVSVIRAKPRLDVTNQVVKNVRGAYRAECEQLVSQRDAVQKVLWVQQERESRFFGWKDSTDASESFRCLASFSTVVQLHDEASSIASSIVQALRVKTAPLCSHVESTVWRQAANVLDDVMNMRPSSVIFHGAKENTKLLEDLDSQASIFESLSAVDELRSLCEQRTNRESFLEIKTAVTIRAHEDVTRSQACVFLRFLCALDTRNRFLDYVTESQVLGDIYSTQAASISLSNDVASTMIEEQIGGEPSKFGSCILGEMRHSFHGTHQRNFETNVLDISQLTSPSCSAPQVLSHAASFQLAHLAVVSTAVNLHYLLAKVTSGSHDRTRSKPSAKTRSRSNSESDVHIAGPQKGQLNRSTFMNLRRHKRELKAVLEKEIDETECDVHLSDAKKFMILSRGTSQSANNFCRSFLKAFESEGLVCEYLSVSVNCFAAFHEEFKEIAATAPESSPYVAHTTDSSAMRRTARSKTSSVSNDLSASKGRQHSIATPDASSFMWRLQRPLEYLRAMPPNHGNVFDTEVLRGECEIAYDMRDFLSASLEFSRCSGLNEIATNPKSSKRRLLTELCALKSRLSELPSCVDMDTLRDFMRCSRDVSLYRNRALLVTIYDQAVALERHPELKSLALRLIQQNNSSLASLSRHTPELPLSPWFDRFSSVSFRGAWTALLELSENERYESSKQGPLQSLDKKDSPGAARRSTPHMSMKRALTSTEKLVTSCASQIDAAISNHYQVHSYTHRNVSGRALRSQQSVRTALVNALQYRHLFEITFCEKLNLTALDSKALVDRACATHAALVFDYFRSAPIEARVSIRYQPTTSLFIEERREIAEKEEKMMRGLGEKHRDDNVSVSSDDDGDVDNDGQPRGKAQQEARLAQLEEMRKIDLNDNEVVKGVIDGLVQAPLLGSMMSLMPKVVEYLSPQLEILNKELKSQAPQAFAKEVTASDLSRHQDVNCLRKVAFLQEFFADLESHRESLNNLCDPRATASPDDERFGSSLAFTARKVTTRPSVTTTRDGKHGAAKPGRAKEASSESINEAQSGSKGSQADTDDGERRRAFLVVAEEDLMMCLNRLARKLVRFSEAELSERLTASTQVFDRTRSGMLAQEQRIKTLQMRLVDDTANNTRDFESRLLDTQYATELRTSHLCATIRKMSRKLQRLQQLYTDAIESGSAEEVTRLKLALSEAETRYGEFKRSLRHEMIGSLSEIRSSSEHAFVAKSFVPDELRAKTLGVMKKRNDEANVSLELQRLNDKIVELTKEHELHTMRSDSIHEREVRELSSSLARSSEVWERYSELKRSHDKLTQELSNMRHDFSMAEMNLADLTKKLEAEKSSKTRRVSQSKPDVGDLRGAPPPRQRRGRKPSEVQQLRTQLHLQSQELKHLRAVSRDRTEELSKVEQLYDKRTTKLRSQLREEIKVKERLIGKSNALRSDLSAMEGELRSRDDIWEKSFKENQNRYNSIAAENERLRARVAE